MSNDTAPVSRRRMMRAAALGSALGLGGIVGSDSATAEAPRRLSRDELLRHDGVTKLDERTSTDCDPFAMCTGNTCSISPIRNYRHIYECCDDGCELVTTRCECPAQIP
ncbi:hypothetical protein [Halovivax cerinus]|uniref:Secreted protein n=1 Tax=Halovivax cerinus TaxID=1487865 RepID=A0ABD5NM62_9EURY|nr:hypothetical protein [Halovivax cerinus]